MEDLQGYKKLGIIGGLGPAATAELFSRIVKHTNVDRDQDHLDITVLNRPQIPDRTAFILGKSDQSYLTGIRHAALDLQALGCEVLCMPCITGHFRSEEAFSDIAAHFIHMPRETAQFLQREAKKRVGIMATDGTIKARVLQDACEQCGLEVVLPDAEHQNYVMSIIYNDVKAGKPADMKAFDEVCRYFAAQGCDSAVLGCTELSVINAPRHAYGLLIVDALDVLAWAAVVQSGAPAKPLAYASVAHHTSV